jgi:peroxiredoxin
MKIRTIFIPLLAVALIGAFGYLLLTPTSLETRPDISLTTIDGEELQLASLQGQPLLVTFWATTCPGCIKEIPHLIELYNELAPRGLEIIAVAMDYDPPNQVLAMRKARNIPYPVALDIHADAARAFGNVRVTPTSFLIAPSGQVIYQKIGAMNMNKLRADILAMLGSSQALYTN